MPKLPRLADAELTAALARLPGWQIQDAKLHRSYRFRDFVEAWGFMSAAALRIQAMDHHPEWFNVWATVRIDLTTHDSGGITARDVELAVEMERLAAIFPQP